MRFPESAGILRRIPQRGKVAAVMMLRVISSFAPVMKLSHLVVRAARNTGDYRAVRVQRPPRLPFCSPLPAVALRCTTSTSPLLA